MGTFPWCNAILALLLPRPLAHLWNDELVFLFIFYLLELNNFELKDFSWLWVIYNTHIQYIDLQMFDCLCYICYIYIVFISSVLLYPSLCLLHFPTLICLSVCTMCIRLYACFISLLWSVSLSYCLIKQTFWCLLLCMYMCIYCVCIYYV